MPFVLMDDKFHSNPKVIAAGNAAVGLYARLLSWSSDNGTDGYVPEAVARQYGTRREILALVEARRTPDGSGLLDETYGGFLIPDFLDHNPSAAQVRERRAEKSQVKARAGQAGGVASGESRRAKAKQIRSKDEADGQRNEAPHPHPHPVETSNQPPPVSEHPAVGGGGVSRRSQIVFAAAEILLGQTAGQISNPVGWTHTVAQRLQREHSAWLDEVVAAGNLTVSQAGAYLARRDLHRAEPEPVDQSAAEAESGAKYGAAVAWAQHDGDMLHRQAFLDEIEGRPEGWTAAAVVAYDATCAALPPAVESNVVALRRQS